MAVEGNRSAEIGHIKAQMKSFHSDGLSFNGIGAGLPGLAKVHLRTGG